MEVGKQGGEEGGWSFAGGGRSGEEGGRSGEGGGRSGEGGGVRKNGEAGGCTSLNVFLFSIMCIK